jgi:hypothetical protein
MKPTFQGSVFISAFQSIPEINKRMKDEIVQRDRKPFLGTGSENKTNSVALSPQMNYAD